MIALLRSTALRRAACAFALCSPSAHATIATVFDSFEFGPSENGWVWENSQDEMITTGGGDPGAWVDTGLLYLARHPAFLAEPAPGTPLAIALASGRLRAASVDIQRLDETGVQGCQQTHLAGSFVSLALFDLHSDPDPYIWAHTDGSISPAFPDGFFRWMTASFTVPPASTETPPGWILHVPAGFAYTWADLLANIDDIRFYVGDPEPLQPSSCSHLGADNALVTYDDETIYFDGFDAPQFPGRAAD